MKNVSILGSTGSIGRNALDILAMFPEQFTVKALAAGHNADLLARQVARFHPEVAAVFDKTTAQRLEAQLPPRLKTEILFGQAGYDAAATLEAVDLTVTAVVGAAGLAPTLAAIEAGKTIALANKETLVMAGDIVMRRAAANGVRILPIDSEHSAVFQCLQGQKKKALKKIILTASGGPFLNRPASEFGTISLQDALRHPNWKMGAKITIDSATLMNKGLEVLEARCLFNVGQEIIDVIVHPQSIIHSMVAFQDGSVIAQLGIPDMKSAIAYALSYPERLATGQPPPDFVDLKALTFQQPDLEKFPCLALAFEACRRGGTLPAVLNAANEIAVQSFLEQHTAFIDIPRIVKSTMAAHAVNSEPMLADIIAADQWARKQALQIISDVRE